MLAVHSPVLKAMIRSEMVEASKKQVTLDHIKPKIMEVILDYMYCGQVSFLTDQLMEMIKTTNYLQMMKLKDMYVDQVPAILGPTNVISWRKLGNQVDLADVTSRCSKIIMSSIAEISQQQEFLILDCDEVQAYFDDVVRSDTDQNKVLLAVMRWVNHDSANRLDHLEKLLCQVQLDNCSLKLLLEVQETYATIIAPNINVFLKITKTMKQAATQKSKKVLTIIGGRVVENANHTCWHLNEAKQFIECCKVPFDGVAQLHGICKTPVGFAITDGENSDLCIMFIAAMKSWVKLENMPTTRCRHGSICIKGVLLVFGGKPTVGLKRKSVDFLALENKPWQRGPDIPVTVQHPKVAEITGSVYLLDEDTRQLMQLDNVTTDMQGKAWTMKASLPGDGNCEGVSMISVDNHLCVTGGDCRITAWYDPMTNAWSLGQQTIKKHWYGPLVHHNDVLYLLGGSYKTTYGDDDIEELSIEGGTWTVSNMKMPKSLMLHQALELDFPKTDS